MCWVLRSRRSRGIGVATSAMADIAHGSVPFRILGGLMRRQVPDLVELDATMPPVPAIPSPVAARRSPVLRQVRFQVHRLSLVPLTPRVLGIARDGPPKQASEEASPNGQLAISPVHAVWRHSIHLWANPSSTNHSETKPKCSRNC